MKTTIEKTSGLGRKLNVEISATKVTSAFDKVYKGLQKNANIKGFRKGKAPLNIIKQMYADRVKQDVLEDLVSMAYSSALKEHTLHPVSEPTVNFDKLEEDGDFSFTAEFEIRPEVNLKKVEKLKVETEKLEVKDDAVDTILNQLRESRATDVPVFEDRAAQKGDVAEIDFKGTIDGQPLEGGSMDGHKLQLGSNSFIPGFEEGVIGMRPGQQKVLNLKFPDDYGHKEIAGKQVVFDVTLKTLLKKQMPELNDEFVKGLGGYSTLEELKNVIKQDVTQQETQRIRDELKNRILKVLVDENPVEVPKALLAQQKEHLIADVERRMKQQGMSEAEFAEYVKKWDSDFNETAAFMIQSSFLIEAIADKNKFSATQSEFEERLEKYAKQSGIDLKNILDFYNKNPERKGHVKYQIVEEKVVQYLVDQAELKEVPKEKLVAKT